jgi:hypothetical protein
MGIWTNLLILTTPMREALGRAYILPKTANIQITIATSATKINKCSTAWCWLGTLRYSEVEIS